MESTMNKHQGLHIDGDFPKFFGFRWRRGSESCDTCRFRLVHTHAEAISKPWSWKSKKRFQKNRHPNLKNWYFLRSSLNPKKMRLSKFREYIYIYSHIRTYIYICIYVLFKMYAQISVYVSICIYFLKSYFDICIICIYLFTICIFSFNVYRYIGVPKLKLHIPRLHTPNRRTPVPAKWWLKDYFPFGKVSFQGIC